MIAIWYILQFKSSIFQINEYRIYSAKWQVFFSLEWLQITKSVLRNFAIIWGLPFLNNPKDLDPSYKMDLDFRDCFGSKKNSVL